MPEASPQLESDPLTPQDLETWVEAVRLQEWAAGKAGVEGPYYPAWTSYAEAVQDSLTGKE